MKNFLKKKESQLNICLKEDVEMDVTNGFEKYQFVHCALPEIDFRQIDTLITFLGKKLSAPILISSMVGGTTSALRINRNLATAAQRVNVAMGVGSARIALQAQTAHKLPPKARLAKGGKAQSYNLKLKTEEIMKSFQVRKVAPDILLFANLGAVNLNYGFGGKEAKKAVEMIGADGLILHLNPLQEVLQKDGQTNFKGVLEKIKKLVHSVDFPIIIKEVGCGISYEVAKKLYDAGVKIIDTVGAGGTSWAYIEAQNSKLPPKARLAKGGKTQNYPPASHTRKRFGRGNSKLKTSRNPFKNWGVQTAESLVQCKKVRGLKVIASGGIRNGVEIAKAIALGADLVGVGLPLLKSAQKSKEEVEETLKRLIFELKLTMFCVGAENIEALRKVRLIKKDYNLLFERSREL